MMFLPLLVALLAVALVIAWQYGSRLLVAGAKAAGIHLEAKQWSWQHVEGLEIIIKKGKVARCHVARGSLHVPGGLLSLLWVVFGSLPSVQLEVEGLHVELRPPGAKRGKRAGGSSSGHVPRNGSSTRTAMERMRKQLRKLPKLIRYLPGLSVSIKGLTVAQQGSVGVLSVASASLSRQPASGGPTSQASVSLPASQQPPAAPGQAVVVVLRVTGVTASHPQPSSTESPSKPANMSLCSSVTVSLTVGPGNRPPLSAVAVHVGRVALSPELLSWVLVRQPATQLASNTDVQISADQDSSADMPNQTAQQSTEPDTQPSNGSQAAQEELKPGSAVIFTELRGLLQLLPREVRVSGEGLELVMPLQPEGGSARLACGAWELGAMQASGEPAAAVEVAEVRVHASAQDPTCRLGSAGGHAEIGLQQVSVQAQHTWQQSKANIPNGAAASVAGGQAQAGQQQAAHISQASVSAFEAQLHQVGSTQTKEGQPGPDQGPAGGSHITVASASGDLPAAGALQSGEPLFMLNSATSDTAAAVPASTPALVSLLSGDSAGQPPEAGASAGSVVVHPSPGDGRLGTTSRAPAPHLVEPAAGGPPQPPPLPEPSPSAPQLLQASSQPAPAPAVLAQAHPAPSQVPSAPASGQASAGSGPLHTPASGTHTGAMASGQAGAMSTSWSASVQLDALSFVLVGSNNTAAAPDPTLSVRQVVVYARQSQGQAREIQASQPAGPQNELPAAGVATPWAEPGAMVSVQVVHPVINIAESAMEGVVSFAATATALLQLVKRRGKLGAAASAEQDPGTAGVAGPTPVDTPQQHKEQQPTKQRKKLRVPLHLVSVSVEGMQVVLHHRVPVTPALCTLLNNSSSTTTTPAARAEASGSTPPVPVQAADDVLSATQVLHINQLHATAAPLVQRWVLQCSEVSLAQEAHSHMQATTTSGAPAASRGSAPLFQHTPLQAAELEVRGSSGEGGRLVRVSAVQPSAHLDFDSALLLLGLAASAMRHATTVLGSAAAASQGTQGGEGAGQGRSEIPPTATGSAGHATAGAQTSSAGTEALLHEVTKRRAAKPPLVVELRLQEAQLCANVGDKDRAELRLGLCRASTRLKEVAVDDVLLSVNDRRVISASYASIMKAAPVLQQEAHSSTSSGTAPEATSSPQATSQQLPRMPSSTSKVTRHSRRSKREAATRESMDSMDGIEELGAAAGLVWDVQSASHLITSGQQAGDEGVWPEALARLGPDTSDEPLASLGSRRAQWSLQKQDSGEGGGATGPGKSAALLAGVTRDLRRGEARKRHGISSSSVPSPDGQPTEAQVMGLDVLLDQAVLSVPHDEAPMRVYVLGEVWGKAVGQVLTPLLASLKHQVQALKEVCRKGGAKPGGSSQPALKSSSGGLGKYIELVLDARRIALSLEQHPLEAWMSAHAAALQQTAAQRHLWERLLASLPTPRQSPPPPPPPAPGAAAAVAPPSALGAPSLGEDAGMSTVGSEGEEVGSEDSLTDSSSDEDEDAGPHTPGGGQASPRPPVHVAKAMQGSSQQALSAGSPGGSSVSTSQPGGSHWAQVMANVCSEYILACQALARKAGGGVSEGAVFTLHASTGAGVIMLAKPGAWGRAHAVANIKRLDVGSADVSFERIVPLSLDVGLKGVTVSVAGAATPLASVASVSASGWLIRARQLTARPTPRRLVFRVGRFHEAAVETAVKGSRPPMKSYTDLSCDLEGVVLGGGVALEPIMASVAKAFKRLIPPDALNPDGSDAAASQPPGPTLQPWDKMRYVLRGQIRVKARDVSATLAAGLTPVPVLHHPCVTLSASSLSVLIDTGICDVTATQVDVVAHARAPDSCPGDPLLAAPVAYVPLLKLGLHADWRLPGGRDPRRHHLFTSPPEGQAPPEGMFQAPLDVVSLARGESFTLGISVDLLPDYTMTGSRMRGSGAPGGQPRSTRTTGSGEGLGRGGPSDTPPPPSMGTHFTPDGRGLQASPAPRVYLGELQLMFLKDLIYTLQSRPPSMKASAKRRCFYEPRRPPPPPAGSGARKSAGLGLLLSKLDLNISADALEVYHDAQDGDDPSDMVALKARGVDFSLNIAYSRVERNLQLSNRCVTRTVRQGQLTRLTVKTGHLQMAAPNQAAADAAATKAGSAGAKPSQGGGGMGALCEVEGGGEGTGGVLPPLVFGQGLIACASSLELTTSAPVTGKSSEQQQGASGAPAKRPIRMVVADLRLLGSTESRLAFACTATHLASAFTYRPAALIAQLRAQAARQQQSELQDTGPGAAAGGGGRGQILPAGSDPGTARNAAALGPSLESQLRDESALLQHLLAQRAARMAAAAAAEAAERSSSHLASEGSEAPTDPGPAVDERPPLVPQASAGSTTTEVQRGGPSSQSIGTRPSLPGGSTPPGGSTAGAPSTTTVGKSKAPGTLLAPPSASAPTWGAGAVGTISVAGQPQQQQQQQHALQLQLVFEVEFVRPQVVLLPEHSSGALLLGIDSAALTIHRWGPPVLPGPSGTAGSSPGGGRRLKLQLDGLQAYAIRQLGDPHSGAAYIPWLPLGGPPAATSPESAAPATCLGDELPLSLGSGASAATTIMRPFSITVIHSKLPPEAKGIRAASDIQVAVPEITGQLDSWAFDVVLDVIQNVLLVPLPDVPLLLPPTQPGSGPDSSAGGGPVEPVAAAVASSPDVAAAWEQVVTLRQLLRCLQHELLIVAPGAVHTLWVLGGAVGQPGGIGSFAPSMPQLMAAISAPALPAAAWQRGGGGGGAGVLGRGGPLGRGGGGRGGGRAGASSGAPASQPQALASALARNTSTLVAWCLDQVVGAADSMDAAMSVHGRIRAQVELLARAGAGDPSRRGAPGSAGPGGGSSAAGGKGPLSATITLGRFNWKLAMEGQAFVEAELVGLEYTSAVGRDYTGSTRFQLRSFGMRDMRASAASVDPQQTATVGTADISQARSAADSAGGSAGDVAPGTEEEGGMILSLWDPSAPPPPAAAAMSTPLLAGPGESPLSPPAAAATPLARAVGVTWEHEHALSVYVIHGGMGTDAATGAPVYVYDHMEVLLHPVTIRLTAALAQRLQAYFSLSDDNQASGGGAGAGQEEAGAAAGASGPTQNPSGDSPVKGPGGKGGLVGWLQRRGKAPRADHLVASAPPLAAGAVGGEGEGDSHAGVLAYQESAESGGAPEASLLPPALAAAVAATPVPPSATAQHQQGGTSEGNRPGSHARSVTADSVSPGQPNRYGALYRRGRLSGVRLGPGSVSGLEAPALAALPSRGSGRSVAGGVPGIRAGRQVRGGSGGALPAAAGGEGGKGWRRRRTSGTLPAAVTTGGAGVLSQGGGATGGGAQQGAGLKGKEAKKKRLFRFRHVRFNRMHALLTYEGPPLNVRDLKLVLDACVYQGVEGTWRTLLNRYKWDCIRSVVKSMAGLQKGKVAELEGRGGGARLLQPLTHQLQHGLDLLRHHPAALAAAVSGSMGAGGATSSGLTAADLANLPPGQLKKKGKGFLKLLGITPRRQGGPGSTGSSEPGGGVDEHALAELLARAEVERERSAKMTLLLGALPQMVIAQQAARPATKVQQRREKRQ